MADNPIRKEDIIDQDSINQAIRELTSLLEKLSIVISSDLKKSADDLAVSLKGVNVATKEGQEQVKAASQQASLLSAEQKQLNKLDQERINLQAKLKTATSDQAQGNARLRKEIAEKNRVMKEAIRLDDSAEGSVNKMRSRLKELTAEYNKLGPAASKQAAPAIKKLTDELKKSEGAIGNNTRNVGNYSSALSGLPGPLGMAVMGLQRLTTAAKAFIATPIGAVIAVIAGAVGTLTSYFRRSEEGQEKWNIVSKSFLVVWNNILDVFSKVGKAIFGVFKNMKDLISGDKSFKEAFHDIGEGFKEVGQSVKNFGKETKAEIAIAKDLAQLENDNIKRTRQWGIEKERIEAKINQLREDGEKRDEFTAAQRIKFMDEAIALEDKVYQQEKKLAEERLKIQKGFNAISDSNRDDLQKEADLEMALINLQSQRDLSQRTIQAKRQALLREELKELKAIRQEEIGKVTVNLKSYNDDINNLRVYTGLKKDEISELVNFEISEEERLRDFKRSVVDESFAYASSAVNTFSQLFEAAKQRELSAAGDNAEAREKIEREYAKKQQLLSIAQALISGAIAITEIWRKWAAFPVLAGIFTALSVAQTAAQVAIIRSQKFAHGGSGVLEGAVHASGGVKLAGIGEAEGGEHFSITSRKMTSKYGAGMLDAVSTSINQGKFFEVWSNANKNMGMGQDIYTKKMYEMMRNTPSIYTDTTGETVKEYPDGRKYIIKKFSQN